MLPFILEIRGYKGAIKFYRNSIKIEQALRFSQPFACLLHSSPYFLLAFISPLQQGEKSYPYTFFKLLSSDNQGYRSAAISQRATITRDHLLT